MATTGWFEQGVALALRVTGEVTVAPPAGLVTVTAAIAGTAHKRAAVLSGRKRAFMQGPDRSSEHTWSSCKISLAETGGHASHKELCPGCSLDRSNRSVTLD